MEKCRRDQERDWQWLNGGSGGAETTGDTATGIAETVKETRAAAEPPRRRKGRVTAMAENATVTIPIDEYFDLRTKAEANMFLMTQIGDMQNRLYEIDKRLFELEQKGR